MEQKTDRWGSNVPQWEYDFFDSFFRMLVKNDKVGIDYLHRFIVDIYPFTKERDQVGYILRLNEKFSLNGDSIVQPYQMEAVFNYFTKLAEQNLTEWARLLGRVASMQSIYAFIGNTAAKKLLLDVLKESPFQDGSLVVNCKITSCDDQVVELYHQDCLSRLLVNLGYAFPAGGEWHDVVIIIPPEALKLFNIFNVGCASVTKNTTKGLTPAEVTHAIYSEDVEND